MKVIALLPIRNEEWVLPTTLPGLKRFVDDIVVLDGHSEDRSRELVKAHGGHVLQQEGHEPRYASWRQALLEEGRRRGGTHFVWLDADEAFTANFQAGFRDRLAAMQPGHKLALDWLALWNDARRFRSDPCVWSRNYKDVVFCDDGQSAFDDTRLHEGRTPGPNTSDRYHRLPRHEGAILHFQFTPFERFQLKQAFVRCLEWRERKDAAWRINERYAITNDDPAARTEPVPTDWLEGLPRLDDLPSASGERFLKRIAELFSQDGIQFYEPLAIWHISALRDRFRAEKGREPIPAEAPLGRTAWLAIKKTLKRALRAEVD